MSPQNLDPRPHPDTPPGIVIALHVHCDCCEPREDTPPPHHTCEAIESGVA